jgi:hypothetical protein
MAGRGEIGLGLSLRRAAVAAALDRHFIGCQDVLRGREPKERGGKIDRALPAPLSHTGRLNRSCAIEFAS